MWSWVALSLSLGVARRRASRESGRMFLEFGYLVCAGLGGEAGAQTTNLASKRMHPEAQLSWGDGLGAVFVFSRWGSYGMSMHSSVANL